ncbi:hypothetical protein BB560_000738 [Smittium megazygosporum]|uniref:glutathione transferase n=1 Tax=Smittium megazygosporum TaxID=133381 RepID=A0A2T9ZJM5_9FUNG|nr:hypothetical protein BB560_000738 [Smittium megazygosporum]
MTSYIVTYFPIDGFAWAARTILTISGAEYKNEFPDWPADKKNTPFGRLPVLTEISPDGSKFVLAEIDAIDAYLAEKYGYLPKDIKDRATVMQYYYQIRDLSESFSNHIVHFKTDKSLEKYVDRIETFIEKHEDILAKSKSGYYFGDSPTLPDLYLYYVYNGMARVGDKSLNHFSEEKSPAISRLVAKVGAIPNIKKAFMSSVPP